MNLHIGFSGVPTINSIIGFSLSNFSIFKKYYCYYFKNSISNLLNIFSSYAIIYAGSSDKNWFWIKFGYVVIKIDGSS